jgi:hypothetical protein
MVRAPGKKRFSQYPPSAFMTTSTQVTVVTDGSFGSGELLGCLPLLEQKDE